MTCKNCLVIFLPLLFSLGLVYRILIITKPKHQFITINTDSYDSTVKPALELYQHYPKIATQALQNITLVDLLKADSLYKIFTKEQFKQEQIESCIELSKLDQESHFIHVSFGKQVEAIVAKFFDDKQIVLIAELNPDALSASGLILKTEQNKADGEFFPHLYGTQKIPLKAMSSVIELEKESKDTWNIKALSLEIT